MPEVITYLCDACDRRLEVDIDLLGRKAACPYCGNISVVRSHTGRSRVVDHNDSQLQQPSSTQPPRSAPADSKEPSTQSQTTDDRASRLGLPPDSGPEVHVLTVHPVTIRAHPWRGFGVLLGIAAAVAGAVWLYGKSRQAQPTSANGGTVAPNPAATSGVPGMFDEAGGWSAVASIGMYACIVLALAGLGTLAVWWVLKRSVALIITNKRTTLREGLFSRHSREVLHDRVQDIQVTQTFPQRVLRTGSIGISNSGDAGIEIEAHDLPNPIRIRSIIDAYRGKPGE